MLEVKYICIKYIITEASLLAGHAGVSALARLQEAASRGRFGGGVEAGNGGLRHRETKMMPHLEHCVSKNSILKSAIKMLPNR